MPKFADYEEYEDDHLELPIHGKTYRIPPASISTGALLARVRAGETDLLDGMSNEDAMRLVLGPAYDEMVADDISSRALGRAYMTAGAFHEGGADMAKKVWDRSIDPELEAALEAAMQKKVGNRASRRASTRSSSTAAASRTPSPASTSGTRSPKGTRRAAPAKGIRGK